MYLSYEAIWARGSQLQLIRLVRKKRRTPCSNACLNLVPFLCTSTATSLSKHSFVNASTQMRIIPENIIAEGSLKRCRRTRVLGAKWCNRYMVLYKRDSRSDSYVLLEFKSEAKSRIIKTYDLDQCSKVESHLTLSDPSLNCGTGNRSFQWIFSISLTRDESQKELYFVADSEDTMKTWVDEICKTCILEPLGGSSVPDSLEFLEPIDRVPAGSTSISRSGPREQNLGARSELYGINETASVSGCSSLGSSRRNMTTEDDSASCVSAPFGPPVPPRGRPTRGTASERILSIKMDGGRILNKPISSYGHVIEENESSGETIKYSNVDRNSNEELSERSTDFKHTKNGVVPPPVDRSNKPANLRLEDDHRRKKK
ncbi:unnamed protein product [Caenorhabditis auriculariae]|uniref:PH domain-containing protein n=1 Tax=Caenorhabditis auriculariae TaxID=2777116 RepID=A0A8S1GUH9_9PELO|nr:unnamed protein product [Caenorhabditis auriculariae]